MNDTDDADTAHSRADELIAEANRLHGDGRTAEAIPLYREAAALFAPYATFELVAADSLFELGPLAEAAESYRRVVDAAPEHEQAWQRLALVLYQLGRRAEADQAMARFHQADAALVHEDVADIVERYHRSTDLDERERHVTRLLKSIDDGVSEVLHDFLERTHLEGTHREAGADYAPVQASILVRFGMADFVYWYSDGPAPDRAEIERDMATYLATHDGPPPLDEQQPIWASPPPRGYRPSGKPENDDNHTTANTRSAASPGRLGRALRRLFGRLFRRNG